MITPYDIEVKEFSKSLRGFNPEEVDDFLDEVILSMQELLAENERLKDKVETLSRDMEKYRHSENSVANTIESAKKLMNDISESAERRAEIIIKNAQLDAEVIQRDAKESVARMTEEGERLKQKVNRYRERYRQLLEDELSQLDGSSEDLFAELERDFMPASMDVKAAKAQTTVKPVKVAPAQTQDVLGARSTMVIDDKSIEEILKESYGVAHDDTVKVADRKEDLTKTKVF